MIDRSTRDRLDDDAEYYSLRPDLWTSLVSQVETRTRGHAKDIETALANPAKIRITKLHGDFTLAPSKPRRPSP